MNSTCSFRPWCTYLISNIDIHVHVSDCCHGDLDGDDDMDQRSLLASDLSSPGAEEEDVPAGNLVTHYRIREVIVDQVAVARNGYAATKESALNLAVGEGVLVLEYRGDGDIYQVKNRNGVVGLVPETVLSQPTSLWEFPWYHGAISREESERMLQGRTYGSYLVRDGHNDNYPHTLTLIWERGVLHYRIHRNITSGMLRIADDELFYTLAELVQYYSKDADGLVVALCYPVPKRESAARHSSGAAGIFGREKPRPGVASGQQSCNGRNVSEIYRVIDIKRFLTQGSENIKLYTSYAGYSKRFGVLHHHQLNMIDLYEALVEVIYRRIR